MKDLVDGKGSPPFLSGSWLYCDGNDGAIGGQAVTLLFLFPRPFEFPLQAEQISSPSRKKDPDRNNVVRPAAHIQLHADLERPTSSGLGAMKGIQTASVVAGLDSQCKGSLQSMRGSKRRQVLRAS